MKGVEGGLRARTKTSRRCQFSSLGKDLKCLPHRSGLSRFFCGQQAMLVGSDSGGDDASNQRQSDGERALFSAMCRNIERRAGR